MVRNSIRNAIIIFALSCVVAGLGMAVYNIIKGNWFSSATYLLVGSLAGIYWFPDLIQKSDPPPEWKALCMLSVILGIAALFNEHPAFDKDRQDGHSQAFNGFISIELYCRPMSPELDELIVEGLKACSLQSYTEMSDAIGQLQNAQMLGPALSIIEGVRSAAAKPNGDWCAETYLVTRKLCPLAFSQMKKRAIASLEIGN